MGYDADYGAGIGSYDLYMQGFSLPMTGKNIYVVISCAFSCYFVFVDN